MRRFLVVLVLCAVAVLHSTYSQASAITVAQSIARTSVSNLSTKSITFGSAMTNPSRIVVLVTLEQRTVSISSIADNKNAGNYTADVSVTSVTSSGAGIGTVAVYSIQNTQTAAATITLTLSANAYATVTAWEITSGTSAPVVDQTASGHVDTGGNGISISLSSMGADDAIFGGEINGGAFFGSADSGFTSTGSAVTLSFSKHFGEYDSDYAAGGSLTLNFGLSTGPGVWASAAAAYKAGAGSGPASSQFFLGAAPHHVPHSQARRLWADHRRAYARAA